MSESHQKSNNSSSGKKSRPKSAPPLGRRSNVVKRKLTRQINPKRIIRTKQLQRKQGHVKEDELADNDNESQSSLSATELQLQQPDTAVLARYPTSEADASHDAEALTSTGKGELCPNETYLKEVNPLGSAMMRVRLDEVRARAQESEEQGFHLTKRCTQLEENASEMAAELAACKAKERAKTVGVGRAQIILNELCLEMVARVGRVDGMHIPSSKGKALRDLQESPAEFAAQTKKNTLIALASWETDRAKLEALARRATDGAAAALEAHEAEHADLVAQSDRLKERIRDLELSAESIAKEVEMADDQSQERLRAELRAKESLVKELEMSKQETEEIRQEKEAMEQEYQFRLDGFIEYPKLAESMADKLDKYAKSSRREHNLMELERRDFRRQIQVLMRCQAENKELRLKLKMQNAQVSFLQRQLDAARPGSVAKAQVRKAVVEGTVHRLQRLATSAKHQASKYEDLARQRAVKLEAKESEVSTLKETVRYLRDLFQKYITAYEESTGDDCEIDPAAEPRLKPVTPEVLEVQRKLGLGKEDMQASLAKLKALREKEEYKDTLAALEEERHRLESRVKDLIARNTWLEKQSHRDGADALSQRKRWPGPHDGVSGLELTASTRRKIRFLEGCTRDIERQREETHAGKALSDASSPDAMIASHTTQRARRRPHSAQHLRVPHPVQYHESGKSSRSRSTIRNQYSPGKEQRAVGREWTPRGK